MFVGFVFKLCIFQNKRVSINKDELKSTSKAIETVHNLCCNENKGASELVAELSTLYQCIRWAEKPVLTSLCWKESSILWLMLQGSAFVGSSVRTSLLQNKWDVVWKQLSRLAIGLLEILPSWRHKFWLTDKLPLLHCRACLALPLEKDDRLFCLPNEAFLAIDTAS